MKTPAQKIRRFWMVAVMLGVLAPLVLPVTSADAYNTFNNHRINGGISDGRFFIDSTAGGTVDVAAITRANDVWVNSPTAYYFVRQSVDVHSKAVFHRNAGTSGVAGFCARTYLYASGAAIDPTVSNWSWGEVHIDPSNFTAAGMCGTQTDQHRGAVIAHEWGHLVGLAHNDFNPGVLMYSDIAGSGVTGPTADEVAGVNSLD
jgi:hypothetical protein